MSAEGQGARLSDYGPGEYFDELFKALGFIIENNHLGTALKEAYNLVAEYVGAEKPLE